MPEFTFDEADRCPYCDGVLYGPPNCCERMIGEHAAREREQLDEQFANAGPHELEMLEQLDERPSCVHCGVAYDGGHRCSHCGNGDPEGTGEFDPETGEQW